MNDKQIKEAHAMEVVGPKPPPISWYEQFNLPFTWMLVHKRLEGKKVLDIGCATGWVAYWAIKEGAKAIATDIYSTSILPTIPFRVADKERLPFGDGEFDMVLTANVLHHGNLEKTTAEAFRVLKRGGEFISFQEPCIGNEVDEEEYLKEFLEKEVNLGIDEHRPNLLKYKAAFKDFNRTSFCEMPDKMFAKAQTQEVKDIVTPSYSGGIAIRAVK